MNMASFSFTSVMFTGLPSSASMMILATSAFRRDAVHGLTIRVIAGWSPDEPSSPESPASSPPQAATKRAIDIVKAMTRFMRVPSCLHGRAVKAMATLSSDVP
jgi:hypothetical protein